MQLNETAKNELRKLIEEKVAQIPDGERIHLDKDLLDSLLFYKLYLQKSKETIKIPIWSGDFLSKIDLSEISFDKSKSIVILAGFLTDVLAKVNELALMLSILPFFKCRVEPPFKV